MYALLTGSSVVRRDEIGQGIEQLNQEMIAVAQRFMVCRMRPRRSMSLYESSHRSTQPP
jgi:hypothetical protein